MHFFPSCNVLGGILRSASGNPRKACPVWQCCIFCRMWKTGREASRITGSLIIQDFSFSRAVPLICATRVHMMNLNNLIPGECKQLKNKVWESLYVEGSATEIFWIRHRWTSFYWRNKKFSSKYGFQSMWLGRAERWFYPGDVSVGCHDSPKHFQGIITLCDSSFFIYCQNHPSNQTAVPWGTVRRGKLPWGPDRGRVLVGRSPCPAGAQQWLWKWIPTSLRHTLKHGWTTVALIRLCQLLGNRLQRKMCTSGWLPKEKQRK